MLNEKILAEFKQSKNLPQQVKADILKLKTKNLIRADCRDL